MLKAKKIALVNPRIENYFSTMPPLGLLYIAAVLEKNGFTVKIFDIYPYDDRDIPGLVSYDPDIIGMTVLTDYLHRARYISSIIRDKFSDSVFIVGGVHVTVLPEESLNEFGADIAVIGEGEHTMLELCNCLSNGADWHDIPGIAYLDVNKAMVCTPKRPYIDNLDELPYPARHLLQFERYLVPPGSIRGYWTERSTAVMTSRGCSFSCIWCGSCCMFGRKVRYRSIDNVIEELRILIKDYRIDAVWFADDTFTLNKSRVMEFCEKMISQKIKLAWGCQAHVKTADAEMFKAMKKAGLVQLDFGVESGSDTVLKALKKHSDAVSIKKAFADAKKAGVRTCATFMFGSPMETEEDVKSTFKLAKEINPNFVSSFFITPYPGTELMDLVKKNGWKMAGERQGRGLRKGPMLTINFSDEDLCRIRREFQKRFTLRHLSNIVRPVYLAKILWLLVRNPGGLVSGMRRFLKTFVVDDFIFAFLDYYTDHRTVS